MPRKSKENANNIAIYIIEFIFCVHVRTGGGGFGGGGRGGFGGGRGL